jgi:hypothetical protein
LLAKDYEGNTVLHLTSFSGNLPTFGIVWEWSKEQMTPEELNKLFLAQNYYREPAWHIAAWWEKRKYSRTGLRLTVNSITVPLTGMQFLSTLSVWAEL